MEICPFVSCDCPVYLGHLIQMHRHKEKVRELRDSPGYLYLRCHLFGCSHRSLGLASRYSKCIWTVNSYPLLSALSNWFKLVYGPLRPKCAVHLISVHTSQGGIKSTKDKEYCLNPMQKKFGIYIPNGCKHLKVFLQLFHGSEANFNMPLKNEKNLWNWEISFTFSWYWKISMSTFNS